MFQDIFSEVILPRENTQQQIRTNSINSLSLFFPIPKVCSFCHHYFLLKKRKKTYGKTKMCMFFLFFHPLFQEEDSFEQLNLIVPGSLICFKQEIGNLFEKEIRLLSRKSRFEFFFRNVKIKPVFTIINSLKNMIVKTKLK